MIPNKHVDQVCRIGQGELCCAFLVMAPEGFECVKLHPIGDTIRARLALGKMNARGDNCEGRKYE